MSTDKGRRLAIALNPSIGTTSEILRICSLLARHATTHKRLAEAECNGYDNPHVPAAESAKIQERFLARVEKRTEQIERRIAELCAQLPTVDGQPIVPVFQGDPRGATVKLRMPDGRYDDYGQEGIVVPA